MAPMPERDPDHWLYRLSSDEWLLAAAKELRLAEEALAGKQQRSGVTLARRAAGMAINALLVVQLDERYGRSYMDHLQALAVDESATAGVRDAARGLLKAPLVQTLVTLGKGDTSLAAAARTIVDHVRDRLAPRASA